MALNCWIRTESRWFVCHRPTDQQACDRVSKRRRDPTHWLDPVTQRPLAENVMSMDVWIFSRQLVPLLTNKDISFITRGRLYSSCVRSSMLHGSETWPVRKENVVALQRAEMRMVRWMCGVKLKDRLPSKELRQRLGVDDIALILQQNRLRWYGHVLRKDDDWVNKCMEYEVEGSRPRGRPKRTWKEVVREDCQACKLNKEDAVDRCKWTKMIKEVRWPGWVWVGECFFWYRPTRVVPDKRPLNCCCCCLCVLQPCCYHCVQWWFGYCGSAASYWQCR